MKKKSPGFHFTLTIDVDLEREQGVGQEPDVCDDDVDPGREQARQGPGIVEILTQNRVSNPANGRVGPGHQRHCDGDASRELRGIRHPRGVPVPVDLPSEGEDDVEERRGERGGADARGADEPRRLPLLLDLRGQSVRETQEAGHGCCSGDGHPGHDERRPAPPVPGVGVPAPGGRPDAFGVVAAGHFGWWTREGGGDGEGREGEREGRKRNRRAKEKSTGEREIDDEE